MTLHPSVSKAIRAENEARFANKKHIEPIYLADRRIVLGPEVPFMTADYHRHKLHVHQFQMVHILAQHLDEVVPYTDLVKEMYGWQDIPAEALQRFKDGFYTHLNDVRDLMSPDLADAHDGAIRTIREIGYQAVSSLEL
jgi:DNA-binding response OmpR family regulator